MEKLTNAVLMVMAGAYLGSTAGGLLGSAEAGAIIVGVLAAAMEVSVWQRSTKQEPNQPDSSFWT